jgi:hypothetical protein
MQRFGNVVQQSEPRQNDFDAFGHFLTDYPTKYFFVILAHSFFQYKKQQVRKRQNLIPPLK